MAEEIAVAATELPDLTDTERERFLALIREKGRSIGDVRALRDAGVKGTRGQLHRLLDRDDDLLEQVAEARGRGVETIRDEIRRRAIEGVEEDVYGSLGGEAGVGVVGQRIVYSDRLLGMMAKAHLPEYRDTSRVELTGVGGAAIPVEVNGGRVTGISDVLELARQLGVGLAAGVRDGLEPAAARDALPAASEVRADPPVG